MLLVLLLRSIIQNNFEEISFIIIFYILVMPVGPVPCKDGREKNLS